MGKLSKISGPLVVAEEMQGAQINEVVRVGEDELMGEIISLKYDKASIQVYEETSGLKPGEKVVGTGYPLVVELGPGLLGSVFDGIQRPLNKILEDTKTPFLQRGAQTPALDREKRWSFEPKAKKGEAVKEGDVLGVVKEGDFFHKILVPVGMSGNVTKIDSGSFKVTDNVAEIDGKKVGMMQKWPVRAPRKFKEKMRIEPPVITGKRIVDTLFPIAKGGTGAIPGPFGSGKCVSGETPVLMRDGSTMSIRRLFEESKKNGRIIEKTTRDELIEAPTPIQLWSNINGKIVPTQTRFIYRDKSDALLRISTAGGRMVEVTPIHKLFVWSGKSLTELAASKLCVGDKIASAKIEMLAVSAGIVAQGQLSLQLISDSIVSIEKIAGPHDVFDVVLPKIENFVGGFGGIILHNTVNQTDFAKYADADIIVYVGCGERGNEMTEVLTEFPKLIDPKTKKPLMNRTVLIANTSNMPVAAREASIYTGITIAEYYRDMGYDVALMADSTSRWAEALREISGRMEEMPGEEGYPAYLGKKLAEFYERSGRVKCLGNGDRVGSITVIGAISPAGGDISEPVSQGTLRITKVFWALDANLARRRHYPAINWLKSYSLYNEDLQDWYLKNVSQEFYELKGRTMSLLQKEAELQNIVQLIGPDALPDKERMVLEATKMIREDFLQQNSFDEVDVYSPLKKQYLMLKTILHFYDKASDALAVEVPLDSIVNAKEKKTISQLKNMKMEEVEKACSEVMKSLDKAFSK